VPEAPFPPVKESSIKASGWSFPRVCNSLARVRKMRSSSPSRTQCWRRRWQVWYGRIFLGQFAPRYACTRDPQNSTKYGPRVLPRPSSRLWKDKRRSGHVAE
jgi:hypothetical protein